jgi:predicted metal-dependent peptidase
VSRKQSKVSESIRARRAIELSIRDLLQDCPFLGALALGLALVEDYTCDTAWTDGVSYGYNPKFVLSLLRVQVKGLSAHEVFHVMLQHAWRRRGRNPEWWNEACDYAINLILEQMSFVLPGGALLNPDFKGMPAEIIYRKLFSNKTPPPPKPQQAQGQSGKGEEGSDEQNGQSGAENGTDDKNGDEQQGAGQSGQDGQDGQSGQNAQEGESGNQEGSGSGKDKGKGTGKSSGKGDAQEGNQPGSGKPSKPGMWGEVRDAPANIKPETLQAKWAIAAERARTIAMARGNMPGQFEELVKAAKEPIIDWKEELWHLVQQCRTPSDYSWQYANSNYMRMGLYVPTLSGHEMPPMVFAKDTSASVDMEIVAQMDAETAEINGSLQPESMWVLDADARVARAVEVFPGDPVPRSAYGRGGTDYRPVFEWVEEQGIQPSVVIYMGDMEAVFPEKEPDYEVIWVMTTHVEPRVPWGHRLRLPM